MATKTCAAPGCRRKVKSETASYCADPGCERARARARRRLADQRARAAKQAAAPASEPAPDDTPVRPAGGVFSATLAELKAAGRVHTSAGQNAIALAVRIDNGAEDSGSSIAALSRQHLAALAEALKNLDVVEDPVDEITARRLKRAAG